MGNAFLRCVTCKRITPLSPPIFSCSNLGDGKYHFLGREFEKPVDNSGLQLPAKPFNPFLLFRRFFAVDSLARERGAKDAYEDAVHAIDENLERFAGTGFRGTPTKNEAELARALGFGSGTIYAKNETRNVTGSHKARHLMGTMIYLDVLHRIGLMNGQKPNLAIYSCGNAALGAAAVAKAAGYKLHVFVPPDVNKNVKSQLEQYEAVVHICERKTGEQGDPCYNRYSEAVKGGCLPFSCSGPDNWSAIEGGQTLGLEFIGATRPVDMNHLVIQAGGGALASSAVGAYRDRGLLDHTAPKIHVVQTLGGYPLVRAYYLLLAKIARDAGIDCSLKTKRDRGLNGRIADYASNQQSEVTAILAKLKAENPGMVFSTLDYAIQHPDQFMWPWESAPHSVAHGILDDVTYDWLQTVTGMLLTGGTAVLASESELTAANKTVKDTTGVNADPTGTSGVAGLSVLRRLGVVQPYDNAGVFLTGVERG